MPCSQRRLPYTQEMKSHESPRKHMSTFQEFLRLFITFRQNNSSLPHAFKINLCGSDSLAETSTTLSRVETDLLTANNLVRLLDNLVTLGQDKLDVAGVRHVRVDLLHQVRLHVLVIPVPKKKVSWLVGFQGKTYTTVGTVCSAALLGGLVDLNVLDNQGTSVKTLGIGVGLGVLEKVEQVLGRLDGPSSLGDTELLAY